MSYNQIKISTWKNWLLLLVFQSNILLLISFSFLLTATIDNLFLYLSLWDSYDDGSEIVSKMRPISYKGVHAFVICFSIYYKKSFDNVYKKVRIYS